MRLSKPVFYILSYPVKIFISVLLFNILASGYDLTADYNNYKLGYDNEWGQFELGYEVLVDISKKMGFAFSDFWLAILLLEVALIFVLYNNFYVFLLAIPNLIYLSQGMLDTQVRFSIAIIAFFIFFSFSFKRRVFYIFSPFVLFFHFGAIVACALGFYLKFFVDCCGGVFSRRNFTYLAIAFMAFAFLSFFMDYVFNFLGYGYYVGTKYQEGKSFSSILYMFFSIAFISYFAVSKSSIEYRRYLYLSLLLLAFSLFFMESSVASGRYLLSYLLIEPFVIYYSFVSFSNKARGVFFPLLFTALSFSKLAALY